MHGCFMRVRGRRGCGPWPAAKAGSSASSAWSRSGLGGTITSLYDALGDQGTWRVAAAAHRHGLINMSEVG
jgi:hypothetical protein